MVTRVFYSRWAPDMAHGFGFPLFIFTSPGPSMLVAFIAPGWFVLGHCPEQHLLHWAWFWADFLCIFLAEDLFGPYAGIRAGVAYVYAPFQAYDVFNRGSLWEAFAWAFPPLVLWGLHRWGVAAPDKGLGCRRPWFRPDGDEPSFVCLPFCTAFGAVGTGHAYRPARLARRGTRCTSWFVGDGSHRFFLDSPPVGAPFCANGAFAGDVGF